MAFQTRGQLVQSSWVVLNAVAILIVLSFSESPDQLSAKMTLNISPALNISLAPRCQCISCLLPCLKKGDLFFYKRLIWPYTLNFLTLHLCAKQCFCLNSRIIQSAGSVSDPRHLTSTEDGILPKRTLFQIIFMCLLKLIFLYVLQVHSSVVFKPFLVNELLNYLLLSSGLVDRIAWLRLCKALLELN